MRFVLRELLKLLLVGVIIGVPMWFARGGPRCVIAVDQRPWRLAADGELLLTHAEDGSGPFRVWNTHTGALVSEHLAESSAVSWESSSPYSFVANDAFACVLEGKNTIHCIR